jgi:hypothetical protein
LHLHVLTYLLTLQDKSSKSSKSSSSSSSSGSSDSDSDSDDDAEVSDAASDWASSEDESSDSESDADDGYAQLKGRARWLKTNTVVKEKVVKDKEGRGQARKEARAAAAAAKVDEAITQEDTKEKEEEMSAAVLNRKCKEVVMSRGRRGTDTKQVLQQLEKLSALSVKYGPRIEIPMLMHTITAQFDLVKTLDDYMETPVWKSCAEHLERVASVLEDGEDESKKFTLGPASTEDDDVMIGNALGKKKNKMKDAAGVGDIGAVNAVAAEVKLFNPHTVRFL